MCMSSHVAEKSHWKQEWNGFSVGPRVIFITDRKRFWRCFDIAFALREFQPKRWFRDNIMAFFVLECRNVWISGKQLVYCETQFVLTVSQLAPLSSLSLLPTHIDSIAAPHEDFIYIFKMRSLYFAFHTLLFQPDVFFSLLIRCIWVLKMFRDKLVSDRNLMPCVSVWRKRAENLGVCLCCRDTTKTNFRTVET